MSKKARLYNSFGHFMKEIGTPSFCEAPKVILWENRVFQLKMQNIYYECSCWISKPSPPINADALNRPYAPVPKNLNREECPRCDGKNSYRNGWNTLATGKKVQRWYCLNCDRTFQKS